MVIYLFFGQNINLSDIFGVSVDPKSKKIVVV